MTRAPAGGTARRVPVRCAGAHARAVPALLRRARRTLGVLALALPAFVALLPPTSAQAQSVSVSNIAKAKSQHVGYLTSSFAVANAFTIPGTSANSYTLNNVVLNWENYGSGNAVVQIHNAGTGSNAGNPGTRIGNSLTGTISSSAGNTTYTAGSSNTITLNGGTTYFVVVGGASGINRQLNLTTDNAEDSTSTDGWTIANDARIASSGFPGSPVWDSIVGGHSIRFTVNATAQSTTVSPPTLGTSVLSSVTYTGSARTPPAGTAAWNESYAFASGTALLASISPGTVTCTAGTAEIGWYRSTALTTRRGTYVGVGGGLSVLAASATAPGEYRALAYCKSGSTYSSAVNLMRGGAVTLTAPTLRASAVTQTGATLTRSHFTGTWYYKADKAPHTACSAAQTGNTVALTGLTAGTSYTYRAYSDSTCTTELTTATTRARFTAQRAVATLRADMIAATGRG